MKFKPVKNVWQELLIQLDQQQVGKNAFTNSLHAEIIAANASIPAIVLLHQLAQFATSQCCKAAHQCADQRSNQHE